MSGMINLKKEFGVQVALIQGPMGGVAGPRLVSAVANCSALGVLPIWSDSLKVAKGIIKETQNLAGGNPFAVNLRADLNQLDHIAMSADLGVNLFHLFWGDPVPSAQKIRAVNGRFMATVGGAEAAKLALDAGASALIAQGVEAGGHVLSETPLSKLLSGVLEVAGDVPVIAAGGIVDAAGARAAIEQGASGVLCGSRFVVSEESDAHELYKTAMVEAGEEATVRSTCYDLGWPHAPHRTLDNTTYRMWEGAGFPDIGSRPGEGDIVLTTEEGAGLPRYFVMPPKAGMSGDILAAALYGGTGVGGIQSVLSVQQIVDEFSGLLG